MPLASVALMLALFFAQAVNGVSVTTDSSTYLQGDTIQVTLDNAGPDAVTRGGIVCDDVWPLALEQLQPDGSWQEVPVPRRPSCIGVAGALFQPGQTLMRTVSLSLDPATYRVAYAFDVVGNGPAPNTRMVAYSDPFDVLQTPVAG